MSAVGDALALNTIETLVPQLGTPTRAGFTIEMFRTAFGACRELGPNEQREVATAVVAFLAVLNHELTCGIER